MSKFKGSTWWTNSTTNGGCVGVVVVEDGEGKPRAYLGLGKGIDQKVDEKRISEYGSFFPIEAARQLPGLKEI